MLMKVAALDDESFAQDIIKCCDEHSARYFPLLGHIFGMLTENEALSIGSEDSNHENVTNIKDFVDIYRCAFNNITSKKLSIFKKKPKVIYNGKIFDNKFYKNIIAYCKKENIDIQFARIYTDIEGELIYHDIDVIDSLSSNPNSIFKKIGIDYDNQTIIFTKRGYVDFSGDYKWFCSNIDEILNLIIVGLRN